MKDMENLLIIGAGFAVAAVVALLFFGILYSRHLSAALNRAMEQLKERNKKILDQKEQIQQAQKMEAIGRLTGGVAHDFNNILGIITGYCELALGESPADGPLRSYLQDIKEAGERAAVLTRQLLAFGRRQVLQLKVMGMNDILRNMESPLRPLLGEKIRFVAVADEEAGQVKVDPGQIEQAVMNLALNARDAMPEGGTLTVETKNVFLGRTYAERYPEVLPGPYVMFAVSDTGQGMAPETLDHLFEPFFTTKGRGKGTGLGLPTAYGIVKQSGGHLAVYSEPGRGTSFKIYLPRADAAATSPDREENVPAAAKGSETVLVVEDEERLRKLICRVLQGKGYDVLEAPLGAEAVRIFESCGKPVDLLLTDVIMPEMSGREVADRLGPKRPEMKILFMSGYTDNVVLETGLLNRGTHFLQKPFTPEALSLKVREVLDVRPS